MAYKLLRFYSQKFSGTIISTSLSMAYQIGLAHLQLITCASADLPNR